MEQVVLKTAVTSTDSSVGASTTTTTATAAAATEGSAASTTSSPSALSIPAGDHVVTIEVGESSASRAILAWVIHA
jgi:hypothetical protein